LAPVRAESVPTGPESAFTTRTWHVARIAETYGRFATDLAVHAAVKLRKSVFLYVNAAGISCLHVEGFSWPAALLQPLWALRHGLHIHAVLMLASMWILHGTVSPRLPVGVRELVAFAWFCAQVWIVGRHANHWDLQALRRRGFHLAAVEACADA